MRASKILLGAGFVLIGLFLALYTAVIVGFGAWQQAGLAAAWLYNLPPALTAMPLGAAFWAGVLALLAGLVLRAGG